MIKVFLVEDEIVMRNGIRSSIPWEKEGFQFCGEASDGELAYPLILKEKPDILITDIRMPFMDGLELSRIVRKELPQIKIIILSGYNEFDYAKTAIDLGVTEYLLKPIGSARLLEELKKVASQIEQERAQNRSLLQYQMEEEEYRRQQKRLLWNSLITDSLSTVQLLEKGQEQGVDLAAAVYCIILFKLISKKDSGEWAEMLRMSEMVTALADSWGSAISFDRSPEGWAFLVKGEEEEALQSTIGAMEEALMGIVKQEEKFTFYGGVGCPVFRLRNICDSYREASRAFSTRFFEAPGRFVRSSQIQHRDSADMNLIDISQLQSRKKTQEQIESFLKNGIWEELEDFTEEFTRMVGEENCQSLLYRQYLLMDIYFMARDFLQSMGLSERELPEKYRDINRLMQEKSSVQVQICGLLGAVLTLRDQHALKKNGTLVDEAKQFILENYQREDMSLNMAAASVNITPSYFSSIFSSETGQTFVEFLTSVRLEKAKELLMCSRKRTVEISYEVGYRDAHYFSSIFKKIVGCTPKEYRNRRSRKEEET